VIPTFDGMNLADEVELAMGLAMVLAGIAVIAWHAMRSARW
jgi:hypothetical protein